MFQSTCMFLCLFNTSTLLNWLDSSFPAKLELNTLKFTKKLLLIVNTNVIHVHVTQFFVTVCILNSAERPNLTGYLSLTSSVAAITILISHNQLPSGLVAQLLEQRWSVPEVVGSNPAGLETFSLSPRWPIFLLGLTLRRYYLGIFTAIQYFNIPHLKPL